MEERNDEASIEIPRYTTQEEDLVITSLMRLRKEKIQEFLETHSLGGAGTKATKRGVLLDALEEKKIRYSQIIEYLDQIEPWGKQHVLLYDGPQASILHWREIDWLNAQLDKHGIKEYLQTQVPLALPDKLTLSAIAYTHNSIRIVAVERREGALREPQLDEKGEFEDSEIWYKAFLYKIVRGYTIFEWDFVTNQAFLQITQLPSGQEYDEIARRFFELIDGFINIEEFRPVELRNVIKRLHELEESPTPEARSQNIGYKTLGGRTLTGRSSSGSAALRGESVIDDAMASVREVGVGHLGNFYWLPNVEGQVSDNPLEQEVHVELLGESKRVNFMTANREEDFRYVLRRVRQLGRSAP